MPDAIVDGAQDAEQVFAVAFHLDGVVGGLEGDAVFVHPGKAGIGAFLDIGDLAGFLRFDDIVETLHHFVDHRGIFCEVSVEVQLFLVEAQLRIKGGHHHEKQGDLRERPFLEEVDEREACHFLGGEQIDDADDQEEDDGEIHQVFQGADQVSHGYGLLIFTKLTIFAEQTLKKYSDGRT